MYDMYPYQEPPEPRPAPEPHPALSAVQSSLDRRDNGGEASKVLPWQR